ncbi:hypothetical protein IH601_06055 [Candidatus Bipolaricaulota bacterium]|nr:hypothetical protein [Candidatus Bipolaricaulota bacterium]TFH07996.1 MAG: hypothetical protein E4H08_08565 [Candidatus Atribacteria bacterium]
MTYLIIAGALAFILSLLFVPGIARRRRMSRKAHADYASSRGTLHARQLHAAVKKHGLALPVLVRERDQLTATMESLTRSELIELRQALTTALVNGPLAEVRGIGPTLRDRIVEDCFDGTLESLNHAHRVQGVGEETASDIRSWARAIQNQIPARLKGEFDGKDEILARYGQRRLEIRSRRTELDEIIDARRATLTLAKDKLAVLELVTPATYRAALDGDVAAAERVTAHTLGAFPEWEQEPVWFRDITGESEGSPHGV